MSKQIKIVLAVLFGLMPLAILSGVYNVQTVKDLIAYPAMLVLVLMAFHAKKEHAVSLPGSLVIAAAGYVVTALAGSLLNSTLLYDWGLIFFLLVEFLFLFLLVFWLDGKKALFVSRILYVLVILLGILGVFTFFRIIHIPLFRMQAPSRISLTFGHPNLYASFLLLAAPLGLYWLFHTEYDLKKKMGFLAPWLGLVFFNLAITGSRAALSVALIVLALVGVILVLCRRDNRAKRIITLFGVLLVFAAFIAVIPEARHRFRELFSSTGHVVNKTQLGGRLVFWDAGLRMFARKPVLGWGRDGVVRGINSHIRDDARRPEHTKITAVHPSLHNVLLDELVRGGIPGFVLFLAVLLLPFRKRLLAGWKEGDVSVIVPSLAVAVFLLDGFFNVAHDFISSRLLLWTALGFLFLRREESEKNITFRIDSRHRVAAITGLVAILVVVAFTVVVRYKSSAAIHDDFSRHTRKMPYMLSLDPGNLGLRYMQAGMELYTGFPERALFHFNKIRKVAPDYGQIHLAMGTAYEKLRRYGPALQSYQKQIQQDRITVLPYAKAVRLYLRLLPALLKSDMNNGRAAYNNLLLIIEQYVKRFDKNRVRAVSFSHYHDIVFNQWKEKSRAGLDGKRLFTMMEDALKKQKGYWSAIRRLLASGR